MSNFQPASAAYPPVSRRGVRPNDRRPVPFRGSGLIGTLLLILLTGFPGYAQFEQIPLGSHAKGRSGSQTQANARTMAQPLVLPFFDDFSRPSFWLDTLLWEPGGGVHVNNTAALNPPSKGVVTLDGLDFAGNPYNRNSTITQGATDTLTSRPVNLSAYQAADSLYLSFFWQAQGLGEMPDATDSLRLEFRDAAGEWVRVWSATGQTMEEFGQQLISLTSPLHNYFHESFQFRFRSFGRPSGAYDTWHLDYVYLNRGRRATDTFTRDVAVTTQPGPLFVDYTAMPLKQYFAGSPDQLAPSVSTSIVNLYNAPIFTSYTFRLTDVTRNVTLANQSTPGVSINSRERQEKTATLNAGNAIPPASGPLRLQYTFAIDAGDGIINGVDYRRNDTISGTAVLDDYFAYDDGSAEYGLGLRQRQGRVACRFVLNTPDTLTSVQLYFTHLETDMRGQTFVLSIWKQLDNERESILYQKSEPVRYRDTLNAFVSYELDFQIPLADTFYVGWQQSTDNLLAVGLDKNTDAGDKLFYNTEGTWLPNEDIQGSPMIRPVFGVSDKPVGLEEPAPVPPLAREFTVFPNPTEGLVRWRDNTASRVEVYDVIGRKVGEQLYNPADDPQLDLSAYPKGIYVLRFSFPRYQLVRRVVLH
jgi:hypothetical protein